MLLLLNALLERMHHLNPSMPLIIDGCRLQVPNCCATAAAVQVFMASLGFEWLELCIMPNP